MSNEDLLKHLQDLEQRIINLEAIVTMGPVGPKHGEPIQIDDRDEHRVWF